MENNNIKEQIIELAEKIKNDNSLTEEECINILQKLIKENDSQKEKYIQNYIANYLSKSELDTIKMLLSKQLKLSAIKYLRVNSIKNISLTEARVIIEELDY